MSATHTATGIEALVCADIAERQQTLGVPKYGKTLAEHDASELERLRHLYHELLDGAIYCKWRMEQIKERRAASSAEKPARCGYVKQGRTRVWVPQCFGGCHSGKQGCHCK